MLTHRGQVIIESKVTQQLDVKSYEYWVWEEICKENLMPYMHVTLKLYSFFTQIM